MGTHDKNTLEYKKLRQINNFDDTSDPNIIYIGHEHPDGDWQITKIDKTSGYVFTYATHKLNSAIVDYNDAWTNHLTLSYDITSNAL